MLSKSFLAPVVFACAISGCAGWGDDARALAWRVTVPADVPHRLECRDKQGRIFIESGPELYRAAHREGWLECRRRFIEGETIPPRPLDPARMPPIVFGAPDGGRAETTPAEHYFRPASVQELGLEWRARCEGFAACHAELLRLIKGRGQDEVRQRLGRADFTDADPPR